MYNTLSLCMMNLRHDASVVHCRWPIQTPESSLMSGSILSPFYDYLSLDSFVESPSVESSIMHVSHCSFIPSCKYI
jgi:hypothetical protein